MDEMTLLQEFRAAVAPPDAAVLTRARTQMLDGGDPGPGSRPARPLRLPGTWPKLAVGGLAAAATAAAVVAAVTVPGGAPARPRGTTAARELAYRAAAAAAAQPDVAPGQWVYWQVATSPAHIFRAWTTADATNVAVIVDGKLMPLLINGTSEMPLPCTTVPLGQLLQDDPVSSGCQETGLPVVGPGPTFAYSTGKIPVSYADLSSLPASPVALDRYLATLPLLLPGAGTAPAREFQIIEELLTSYVMPPVLTAELYQALGTIPGIRVNDHAVDAAGRTGAGFEIAVGPGFEEELVTNPKTYQLMGYQEVDSGTGRVVSNSAVAILNSAFVSGPGVVPPPRSPASSAPAPASPAPAPASSSPAS